jgi:biotin transport system substrate-specific component
MTSVSTAAPAATPIVARLWPRTAGNAVPRIFTLILAGTLLLALSAHVQVPFWPVKMSMQTFVVLMLAVAYGGRLAGATVLAYLAEGALGLPVFQSGAGLAYFGGPTTGYLVGFVVAAVVVGMLAERGAMRTLVSAVAVFALGDAIMLALGVAWLTTLIGFDKAIVAGCLVFLPAEALKIALATALMPLMRRSAN